MSKSPEPRIGDWYKCPEQDSFEIVAVDNDDGTIEVQFFDGTIEEWDLETWAAMEISTAAAPEDWSGSLDITPEDYGVDLDRHCAESTNILDVIDKDMK